MFQSEAFSKDSLVQFISKESLQYPKTKIPGSALGALILEKFPGLNIKEEFNGLSNFIKDYCRDTIKMAGKQGSDNLYIHKSRKENNISVSTTTQDFWAVFSNPRLGLKLVINSESNDFLTIKQQENIPAGYSEMQKIDEADYREMAKEFVSSELKGGDTDDIESIIKESNFWFKFAKSISENFGQDNRKKLLRYRTEKIKLLFSKRLVEIGIDEQKAQSIIHQTFKIRKKEGINSKKDPPLAITAINDMPPKTSPLSTRELIHKAIDEMDQNDLRKVWLPAGAIIDALKK